MPRTYQNKINQYG